MRVFNSPPLRALGFACVLLQPGIADLVPPQLAFTPIAGAIETASCGQGREQERERTQRVEDVFKAMGVRPGAAVADIGAGQGFYTVRLAKAVGDAGRVYAVDISASALRDLRARVDREQLRNVEVIEGTTTSPRLPAGTLDAALIVNAYHEMTEHQAMLEQIRTALKPDGKLVILEPISPSRRSAGREAQTRQHEIASELVIQDARAAGYKVTHLEEPFSSHSGHGVEWLMVLTPAPQETVTPPAHDHEPADPGDTSAPDLRISMEEFKRLQASGKVIVLDVRDQAMFDRGHIPGARLVPMSGLREAVDSLKTAGVPIVAYCSCPAEETSARAVLYLRKQGVTNVRALTGGYEGWAK